MISNIVEENLKDINCKRNEFKSQIENGEIDYGKLNKKELHTFQDKNFGELGISKQIQNRNKDDLLVLNDFNILVLRYI